MVAGFIREAVAESDGTVVGEITHVRLVSTPTDQQQRAAVVANVNGDSYTDTVEITEEGYDPQQGDKVEFGVNEDGDGDNFPSCKRHTEGEE